VWLFQRLIDGSENLVNRLPLVKTVYRAIKDFVDYFSPGEEMKARKVVKVRVPGQPITLIGFITREDFSQLPFGEPGEVAVYLPLSYQIGGYTLILPADWLEPVDMPFEDAMRLFAKRLLRELGYAINMDYEVDRRRPIQAAENYRFIPALGAVRQDSERPGGVAVSGAALQALKAETFSNESELRQCKRLMRAMISHQLEHRTLYSRKLFR